MKIMRWQNAAVVCLIVVASLLGLCLVDEKTEGGLGRCLGWNHSDGGQDLENAGLDLYVKPKPPGPEPDSRQSKYPELYATDAIVVTFGADWCGWCKAQARELQGPSQEFNVLYVKIDEAGEIGEETQTRWGELMDSLALGDNVPVTAVIEKGEVTKVFYGFTKWVDIEPFARKAKKNDSDDKAGSIKIGPIDIDWGEHGVDIDITRQGRNKRRG